MNSGVLFLLNCGLVTVQKLLVTIVLRRRLGSALSIGLRGSNLAGLLRTLIYKALDPVLVLGSGIAWFL